MAKNVNKGLGRGFASLMGLNDIDELARTTGTESAAAEGSADGVVQLSLLDIDPNREQPRKNFDEAALEELAQSIRTYGVIQPIVVTPVGQTVYDNCRRTPFPRQPSGGQNGNTRHYTQLHSAGNKGNKPDRKPAKRRSARL